MKQARRISAVLWDLDGTLVDTEQLHAEMERRILLDLGLCEVDVTSLMSAPDWVGANTREAFARGLQRLGRSELLEDAMAAHARRIGREVLERAQPKRGVNRVLLDIPMREVRFAIVTSSDRSATEALVERFGWGWRFEALVTSDDAARRKPDAQPYLVALERLGLSSGAALAVEDSPTGIASARAAGVRCASVSGTFPPEDLTDANWVISGVGAVQGLLTLLERRNG